MGESHIATLAFAQGYTTDALRESLESIRAGEQARVVILQVEAGPHATEAADLRWLELFELPTVATFTGTLEGCAAAVALACDIRMCGEGASLNVPDVNTNQRFLRMVNPMWAVRIVGARAPVDAGSLFSCGLVSAVLPAESLIDEAMRLATVIASRGPIAVALGKEAIWRGLEMPFEQALRFETDLTLLLQTTKDRAEGVRAFLEKREPRFTGD